VTPISLACYFGEHFYVAWWGNFFRYVSLLNATWCVNSVAHMYGTKPYDKNISPTDSHFVGVVALGEGNFFFEIFNN
jgi:stearoyl-CoA desaturase (Delta-9 desaturase)